MLGTREQQGAPIGTDTKDDLIIPIRRNIYRALYNLYYPEGASDDGKAFKAYCTWAPDRPRQPGDSPTPAPGDLFNLDDVGRPIPRGHPKTKPTKGEALYLRAWSLQDDDHRSYSELLSEVLEYLEELSTSSDGTASSAFTQDKRLASQRAFFHHTLIPSFEEMVGKLQERLKGTEAQKLQGALHRANQAYKQASRTASILPEASHSDLAQLERARRKLSKVLNQLLRTILTQTQKLAHGLIQAAPYISPELLMNWTRPKPTLIVTTSRSNVFWPNNMHEPLPWKGLSKTLHELTDFVLVLNVLNDSVLTLHDTYHLCD